jgi:DNA-binding LytR/AlgR family response regulator
MRLRVAIVDDEKPARDRIRRIVAGLPDVEIVGEAGDVAQAVALVDRERPDLLLLDVQIPGGDGFGRSLTRRKWSSRPRSTTTRCERSK